MGFSSSIRQMTEREFKTKREEFLHFEEITCAA